LVEAGSSKCWRKPSDSSNQFEVTYWRERTDKERWQATWNLFFNYHINHGWKQSELRLDRTTIEIGRRPSKATYRRRSHGR